MRGRYETRTWQSDPTVPAPPRYRRACRYDTFLPDPLVGYAPSLASDTVAILSEAEQALHALGGGRHEALGPLQRLLLRTESIASSKVEGLQVDVRALARGEVRAETRGRVSATVAEILANIDAMELAIADAATAESVAVSDIVAIHERLMTNAPNRHVAGRVREVQNWIGGNDYNPCGADFVPPPPELVAGLLDDLCDAIDGSAHAPLVQAALVHAQFETVHPFEDGNGRTGRTLVHVVLRRRGLAPTFVAPISVVFAADRSGYIDGLTRFRDGDVDGWIEQFAVAAARAARLAEGYLGEVDRLRHRWGDQLAATANPRADAAAWAIINVLPAHPVITAPVAQAATGRAKSAIHGALEQLEEADVLLPVSGGARNRSWEADGLLDLVADLEAGELPRSTA